MVLAAPAAAFLFAVCQSHPPGNRSNVRHLGAVWLRGLRPGKRRPVGLARPIALGWGNAHFSPAASVSGGTGAPKSPTRSAEEDHSSPPTATSRRRRIARLPPAEPTSGPRIASENRPNSSFARPNEPSRIDASTSRAPTPAAISRPASGTPSHVRGTSGGCLSGTIFSQYARAAAGSPDSRAISPRASSATAPNCWQTPGPKASSAGGCPAGRSPLHKVAGPAGPLGRDTPAAPRPGASSTGGGNNPAR